MAGMLNNIDTRVQKIPLPLELDPDFGNQRPENVQGFVINVKNKFSFNSYEFILLMPETECDIELEELIGDVMKRFLEAKDRYTIRDLDDNDVAFFENQPLPVLCFHPNSLLDDKISFYWQTPPKHLML